MGEIAAPEASREQSARVRAGRLALVGGTLILAGKLLAWWITGSVAVLSDAAESVVNVVAGGLLLYSLVLAARPADRNHPYGHGKVEFFSAGVEGTLIALAAAVILVESARELVSGPVLRRIDQGLVLLALAAGANAALAFYLIRVGRVTHSLALVADGRHLLTDVLTSAGVIVGLAAVWLTGWVVLDPLVAIAVALNILRTGWKLVRQAVGGLMDEADDELLARVVAELEARRRPWWIDVHSLRSWRSGAFCHADLHVVVPRFFDAERLHEIHDELAEAVHRATTLPGDAIAHFDPCRPRHCAGCAMADCAVRSTPFLRRTALTPDRARREDEMLDTGVPLSAQASR